MKPWLFGAGRRLKHLPGGRYLSPYLIDRGERQGKGEQGWPRNYRDQQDAEGQETRGRDRVLTQINPSSHGAYVGSSAAPHAASGER